MVNSFCDENVKKSDTHRALEEEKLSPNSNF